MTPERLLSIILASGFLAAPPIALLYGASPGLFVLASALAATIALAWNARAALPAHARSKMKIMLGLNGVLLIVTIIALAIVSL